MEKARAFRNSDIYYRSQPGAYSLQREPKRKFLRTKDSEWKNEVIIPDGKNIFVIARNGYFEMKGYITLRKFLGSLRSLY